MSGSARAERPARLGEDVDLRMLVMLGGRERNEGEWGMLLHRGGFELLPRAPDVFLLEAAPNEPAR